MKCFGEEYDCLEKGKTVSLKSRLSPFNPKLDSEGVMQSDSQLQFAKFLPYDARFHMLLPRKHWVTITLIVKQCHEKTKHGGTNATLVELSKKYSVISAREAIRELENNCSVCKILRARESKQVMGPLPFERVEKH